MNNSTNMERSGSRNRLLATVSTLALIVSVAGPVLADDAKPTLWFELGWNFENIRDSASDIPLPLGPIIPRSGLTAPIAGNLDLDRSYTDEGKITFQPENSDWVFSASIRYGRSQGKTLIKQSSPALPTVSFISYHTSVQLSPYYLRHKTHAKAIQGAHPTLDTELDNSQSHLIVDFSAGKDVGLGLFGGGSTSIFSAGVRFAHFAVSRKEPNFHESPGNVHFHSSHTTTLRSAYSYPTGFHYVPWYHTKKREFWNDFSGSGGASQKFSGIGPSIRWDASARMSGNSEGGLSLDWGVNAALLYGKQKKIIHFQSSNAYHCLGPFCPAHTALYASSGASRTSKSIIVPNVGGFAGLSLRYQDIKVSLGYRADLFVNAIDVGFDTRKSSNMLFHGPFASVSLGVGDR